MRRDRQEARADLATRSGDPPGPASRPASAARSPSPCSYSPRIRTVSAARWRACPVRHPRASAPAAAARSSSASASAGCCSSIDAGRENQVGPDGMRSARQPVRERPAYRHWHVGRARQSPAARPIQAPAHRQESRSAKGPYPARAWQSGEGRSAAGRATRTGDGGQPRRADHQTGRQRVTSFDSPPYSPRYAARTFGSLSSCLASPLIVTSPDSIT